METLPLELVAQIGFVSSETWAKLCLTIRGLSGILYFQHLAQKKLSYVWRLREYIPTSRANRTAIDVDTETYYLDDVPREFASQPTRTIFYSCNDNYLDPFPSAASFPFEFAKKAEELAAEVELLSGPLEKSTAAVRKRATKTIIDIFVDLSRLVIVGNFLVQEKMLGRIYEKRWDWANKKYFERLWIVISCNNDDGYWINFEVEKVKASIATTYTKKNGDPGIVKIETATENGNAYVKGETNVDLFAARSN